MRYNSYEILDLLVKYINERFNSFKGVRGFKSDELSLPVEGLIFSFHCKENYISRVYDEVEKKYMDHHETKIAVDCFASYEEDVLRFTQLSDKVVADLFYGFSPKMTSFTQGEIKTDENLRAYRMRYILYFEFDTAMGIPSDI